MVSFDRATQLLGACHPVAGEEWVPLEAATGRIAARTWRAPYPLPRAARSAMDGFAVGSMRSGIGGGPAVWRIDGRLRVDGERRAPIEAGACLAVATGTVLPPGTLAVLPYERVRQCGDRIEASHPPRPGENVIEPGEEAAAGIPILTAGRRITPHQVAAAAAYGHARLPVRCRVRVAVLPTGDELVEPAVPLRRGQVYESTSRAVAAALTAFGAEVAHFAACPDEPGALEAALSRLVGGRFDVIVTTGGVSCGERDGVAIAWERLGAVRLFWRVAMKPGKAVYAGRSGSCWLFGLSGNAPAALASFYALVRPALARLAGMHPPPPTWGRLAGGVDRSAASVRAVWAAATGVAGEYGPLSGVSALEALLRAEALLLLRPERAPWRAGDLVEAIPVNAGVDVGIAVEASAARRGAG